MVIIAADCTGSPSGDRRFLRYTEKRIVETSKCLGAGRKLSLRPSREAVDSIRRTACSFVEIELLRNVLKQSQYSKYPGENPTELH